MSVLLSGSILTLPSIYYPASFLFLPIFCPCVLLLSNLLCWSYEILHFYVIMLVVAHIWYVSRQKDLWLHEARVVGGCWDNMFSYTCLEDLCAFRVSESSCQKTVAKTTLYSSMHVQHIVHDSCYSQDNFVFVIFHQIVTICSASETTFLLMWLRLNGFNQ